MDPEDLKIISSLLEEDSGIREKIREAVSELEKKVRSMSGILNKLHGTPTSQFSALIAEIQPILELIRTDISVLAGVVRPHEFWRVKDMWSKQLQHAVTAILMCEWLRSGGLASLGQVTKELGIKEEWSDRFVLSSEEYLHGTINLVNDLSRLAVNAVIMKDYELPSKIYNFVREVQAGFALLNLKNDPLRRRFDSIKYDVKRVEEVVYDISLRQLNNANSDPKPE